MGRGGTGAGGSITALAVNKMDRDTAAVAGNIPKFVASPAGDVEDALLAAIDLILRTGAVAYTGNQPMGGFKFTGVGDGVADDDLPTIKQLNDLVNGLAWKDEVRAATTADITLSGEQTIDGVAVVAGDRVTVKNQTDETENGIYDAAAGAWSRSADADTSAKLNNATTPVTEGAVNADRTFTQTTANPSLGADDIVWVRVPLTREVENEVSTTDATVTTIATIAIPDDTVVLLETRIVARRTDAAGRAAYVRRAAVFREAAGGATLEGAVDSPFTRESTGNAPWNATIAVSGNNALVQVTGQAGKTVNWKSSHEIRQVS